jgi:RND family efflux transporter MFP subunit
MYGVMVRMADAKLLREWSDIQAVPTVAVVAPSADTNQAVLELPGRLEAFTRAPIYARVNGYVKRWTHDIGSRVKSGELLAEIDTPDIDQQLAQARADLGMAQANANLAQTTASRWQSLADTDAVSRQDVDQRVSALNANLAQVQSAKANMERLVVLKGYARIVAPFGGVVTIRSTDVGALINSGSGNGPQLFEVSDTAKLRVYVNVPQNFVPRVPAGAKATITVPEHPGKSYEATIEASSEAVSAGSGTTLMQLVVDNRNGELMPGGYAGVRLDLADRGNALSIPASALIFDARGLSVATVGPDNRVALKPVVIRRDLGKVVEISAGVDESDRVIANPPDGVVNGTEVRLAEKTKEAGIK